MGEHRGGFSGKYEAEGTYRDALDAGAKPIGQVRAAEWAEAWTPDPRLAARWELVRTALREMVPAFTFHIWIEGLRLVHFERRGRAAHLFVSAPDHTATWIRDRYLTIVRDAAQAALGDPAQIPITAEVVAECWTPPPPDPVRGERDAAPATMKPPDQPRRPDPGAATETTPAAGERHTDG